MAKLKANRVFRKRDALRSAPQWIGYLCVLMLLAAQTVDAQVLPSFGGDRAGTSGFQFLKVSVDPRGTSMGESTVSNATDGSALFWNPALAAQSDQVQISVQHAEYYSDVALQYASIIYPLRRLNITLGASLVALNSGSMDVTTEFEPFGTGETFNFVDMVAGLTVSQALTDLFSYGVTAKYVRESVVDISTSTTLFDLGVFYRVGTSGAQMAVALKNFGPNARPSGSIERTVIADDPIRIESSFESVTPPTTFLLGFSYTLWNDSPDQSLLMSAQLNNPNDNAENWNLGLEYTWRNTLILRSGYRLGLEEHLLPSLGAGISTDQLGTTLRVDYGFSQLDRLGTVHRVGLNISL
ncbi:MAG: PorV/PorQ family protein [Rhodothermales bacterium]|nr:PorV/PorQ family protein [Rhodothermales bacterium]